MLRRMVAQAVEIPRPHEAIRHYLFLSEELIAKRNRGSYAEAARILAHVGQLYHNLGEQAAWVELIDGLRHTYTRLTAFQDELRRAGL